MTKLNYYKATYEVADGYVGKARPLHFRIRAEDLEEDMDDSDLTDLFYTSMQDHFEANVSPESSDYDAFVVWAHQELGNRTDEGVNHG
jgi:hypothetical protein